MRVWMGVILGLVIAVSAAPLLADDLSDSQNFLCVTANVIECLENGQCDVESPSMEAVPRFVEVDLEEQVLRTTKASGLDRTSPLKNVERAGGLILIHGAEQGRSFAWVINERTGLASGSVVVDGEVIVSFAYCTPVEGLGGER